MNKSALAQMPQYSQKFTMDFQNENILYILYIRYYSAWNADGSREPVSADDVYWPQILINNENSSPMDVSNIMNKRSSPEIHILKNFSNYTTIKAEVFSDNYGLTEFTVQGFFEQAGYISLSLYQVETGGDTMIVKSETHYRGDELTVINGGLNPFIKENPSVFSYQRPQQGKNVRYLSQSNVSSKSYTNAVCNKRIETIKTPIKSGVDEKFYFYRPTEESFNNAEYGFQESQAPDGCSADYMASFDVLDSGKQYFILKIKVPTTFIHDDNPETTYAGYQVQELTIDTYSENLSTNKRYSVNSRQLNDYKDSNGYAYVFMAPEDIVTQLALEQGLDYNVTKIPPIYTWNGNTGYVLDLGIIVIRHRGSDAAWEGSLTNAPCYLTDAELLPIAPSDLGEYYPDLTGVDSIGISVK
jgi:hypothetical protein